MFIVLYFYNNGEKDIKKMFAFCPRYVSFSHHLRALINACKIDLSFLFVHISVDEKRNKILIYVTHAKCVQVIHPG